MLMTELYLHIGMNKAGSSSLQEGLLQLQPQLQELGYYYPDPIEPSERSANTRINEDMKNQTNLFLSDVAIAREKKCDLILSSEHIFSRSKEFSDVALQNFSRTLLKENINLHIILVTRDPLSRAISSYKQGVVNSTRMKGKCTPFLTEGNSFSLSFGPLSIMRFQELPATKSALTIKMGDGWLKRFFNRLDPRIPFEDIKLENINTGIPDVYTELIRQFNTKNPSPEENIHFKYLIQIESKSGHMVLKRQARRFNPKKPILKKQDLDFLSYEPNKPLHYTEEQFEQRVEKLIPTNP